MTGPSPGCRLAVLISPRAKADALVGWQGQVLKVRVAAPPEAGAANLALLRFLAGQLGLSASCLSLAAGPGSRRKVVAVEGLTEAETLRRIKERLPESGGP
ncbi:MAG: DUF167 domain-containing protein [Candidatus Adiutrix sp.]|jgi:uncharacterized protein YggU (UPF0235/DUF167 family)|nr:DUF167 domain-containing protein [Candidatus Adiutrix sp.]